MSFWSHLVSHAIIKTVDYTIMSVTNNKVKKHEEQNRKVICETAAYANIQNRNLLVADTFTNQDMLLPTNGMLLLPAHNSSTRLAISDPVDPVQNVVISGANYLMRNFALMTIISNARAKDVPVLVLHTSNNDIENSICTNIPSNKSLLFNANTISYNPFKDADINAACQLIYSSIPEQFGVQSIGREFIKVMLTILSLQGITVDFQQLMTCPFDDLSAVIDKKVNTNRINIADANNLKASLKASQSESRVISHYFKELELQINHISNCFVRGARSASITDGINQGQIMSFNIGANTNVLLIELITNHLKLLLSSGYKFLVILDNVDLSRNKELLSTLIYNSNCRFVFSYDDFYSALNADEQSFTSVMGNTHKTVIYSHPSPKTCAKWSEYLGEYEKHEPEYTYNQNVQGGAMMGRSSGDSMRIIKKMEARVLPGMLSKLSGNEVCIYDSNTKAIFFAEVS